MAKVEWKPGTFLYPIPAVMVSCGDMEQSNIMTVAWTGILNTNPAMCYISVRPERHSYSLIKETGEFVAIKKAGSITPEDIVKINFKAKSELKAGKTEIKITDVVSSEGKADIQINEAKVEIDVMDEQEEIPDIPEKPEKITSEKYRIEKDYIVGILPETTIKQFKQNVTTDNEMAFVDKDGNTMKENEIISTGAQLKVGKTLQYTLIVRGDIDQDTTITINDIAKLKLHLIESKLLTKGSRYRFG